MGPSVEQKIPDPQNVESRPLSRIQKSNRYSKGRLSRFFAVTLRKRYHHSPLRISCLKSPFWALTKKKTFRVYVRLKRWKPREGTHLGHCYVLHCIDENHEKIIKRYKLKARKQQEIEQATGVAKKWNRKMDAWLLYNSPWNCRKCHDCFVFSNESTKM